MKLPLKIRLCASTICQLGCVLCDAPHRKYTKGPFAYGYLGFKNFKKLLDQNPQLKFIELSWKGEIFLNPELKDIIKYAYQQRVELSADGGVNLNDVSEEIIESLVKYKFKSLTISIDGASQKIYSLYRVNGDFDTVIKNIILINHYKKKYNSALPHLCWQFIVFDHNKHEILAAKKNANSLNMAFKTKLSWDSRYSPVKNKNLLSDETGLEIVSREAFLQKYGYNYMKRACRQVIFEPAINFDGTLFGCCLNSNFPFSNIFVHGLRKSLSDKRYMHMIGVVLGRVKPNPDIYCYHCSVYKNSIRDRKKL